MATWLKNLKIKKVDFVDDGANPDAHIKLYKNKSSGSQTVGLSTEQGTGMVSRLISAIGKALNWDDRQIESVTETVRKNEAETFGQKMNEVTNRKINDEIWDVCYALQSSMWSIMNDEEVQNRAELMQKSLQEFVDVMEVAVGSWAAGNTMALIEKSTERPSSDEIVLMKHSRDRLDGMIAEAEAPVGEDQIQKGENEVRIDKSKMTPAEKAFFEELEKRYGEGGAAAGSDGNGSKTTEPEPLGKSALPAAEDGPWMKGLQTELITDPVIKSLQVELQAQLDIAKKHNEAVEDAQLEAVAKKYEDFRKPEELVPVLKALKASGQEVYDTMIASLDSTLEMLNKSTLFNETGRRGVNVGTTSDVEKRVDEQAGELMKADPKLNIYKARDMVLQQNPELRQEYENS